MDVNEEQVSEVQEVEETQVVEETTQVKAGDKTPPNELLKSLQEEREKRRELEERISLLENTTSSDVFSDEGKLLQKQIKEQDSKIESLLHDNAKKDVLITYPIMKDKWEEFETFRNDPENKGMNLRTATKAFLTENGLLEPVRVGLEKTTGGQRVPVSQTMSEDDIKTLRETNFKKYSDMVEKGLIK